MVAHEPLIARGLADQARGEIAAQHGLRHPHIVQMFGAQEVAGHFWMLLEYAPYGSLEQLAGSSPGRRLAPADAAFFVRQVADAVSHLHSDAVKLLHRDIKAGNVLLFTPFH